MKIIKKLKIIIFDKSFVADVIDVIYDYACIFFQYFKCFLGMTGIFYLYELSATKYISNTFGEMQQGFMKEIILDGNLSETVLFLFITLKGLEAVYLLLSHSIKKNFLSIYAIVLGTIFLTASIKESPIITFDRVIFIIIIFMILKMVLIAITKVFKISTRNFGNFMVIESHPIGVAVKNSVGDEKNHESPGK